MCGYVPGVNGPDDGAAGVADGWAAPEARASVAGLSAWGAEQPPEGQGTPLEITAGAPAERVFEAPETRGHTLLAIDTSLGTAVALCHGGMITECSNDDTRGHTEVIGDLIARVFQLADVSPTRVSGVVAGIGPGPFTGLRVGLAAAHAFAVGRGVPIHPLVSHDAVAFAMLAAGTGHTRSAHVSLPASPSPATAAPGTLTPGTPAPVSLQAGTLTQVRIVQDAKRRELFVSGYVDLDWLGMPIRRVDPHLVARSELVAKAADCWPDRVPAARLLQIAARRLTAGQPFDADRALYLRQPDVYPPAAPKRVSA